MSFLLHQILSESARKFPRKIAVTYKEQSITYLELEQMSNKLANTLIEIGAGKGDRIGIYMQKSISSIVSLFGILKTGGVYVPIAPDAPPKRVEYIVNNCGIKLLLCAPDKISNLEDVFPDKCPIEKIILTEVEPLKSKLQTEFISWERITKSKRILPPLTNIIDRDLAYILYTSGSTGDPKGVMTSHLNALTFINCASDLFQINKLDRVANHSPLHFNLSIFDIFVPINTGATVVIIPDGTATFPVRLAELIEREAITIWYSVPSALTLLITYGKLERFEFPSLRVILFAGEIFPIKYLRKLKQCFPNTELYHQYGQTEAYPSTCYFVEDLPDNDSGRIPIGKPVANFRVFALNENSKMISQPGEIGELYVYGSSVTQGYWGDPEKTKSAFVDNPLWSGSGERVFKTGDLATIDEAGNFVFLSRKDNMIKSRGYRIELGEIETVISSHQRVKDIAVVAVPDDLIGNRIKAFITSFEENKLSEKEVLQYCAERIPKYMIPETVEICTSLPRTSTGKIDKKTLVKEAENKESQQALS